MKKLLILMMFAAVTSFVLAQEARTTQNLRADIAQPSEFSSSPIVINPDNLPIPSLAGSRANILYDNGPLVNGPGQGAGGADASILQNVTLSMNTYGFGYQQNLTYSIADDFVVPAGETWSIESFDFFGHQTGSTTTSSFTGGYLQIWNGDPSGGGSVIWGDLTTNRLTSTSWTNIYRVLEDNLTMTNRPIMRLVCSTPGLTLTAGIYWVEYSATGSLSSGPWAEPITITGQSTTGNGKQNLAGTWGGALDTGSGAQQGFPFLISGTGSAQASEVFTASGDGTWTAPAGISTIVVELWGGGGCGDAGTWFYTNGGGGGGAFSRSSLSVTPGQTYNYHIGAGSAPASDQPGEDSWFRTLTTAMAKGGGPGFTGPYMGQGTGGTGGSAGSSIGDVTFSGGNGDDGVWYAFGGYGGGGGSSAGTAAVGNNAVNRIGATAPTGGGNGGNGSNWSWIGNGNGSPGIAPGGGGGGGRNGNGGRGANGRLVIYYDQAPGPQADLSILKTVTSPAAPPYYFGSNITFTIVLTNHGPSNATGITISDFQGLGFQYVSHTVTQGICNWPTTGHWFPGPLASGATATATLTVTILNNGGEWANTAEISEEDQGDPVLTNNSSTVVIEPIELDNVPVANWAIYLGIGLIVAFTMIRFRRIL
ncbi:MAG TPA: DUF11 domain-containing protein [Bacteroidales bacterium]|nr:DUF11 domain-containing protein [Bacteroidales bacterium]